VHGGNGSTGGNTTVTIGSDVYSAGGGDLGRGSSVSGSGGYAYLDRATKNGVAQNDGVIAMAGASGSAGNYATLTRANANGGSGGGYEGYGTLREPTAGGDGHITFEYCDV
jgi:hypothetical protein